MQRPLWMVKKGSPWADLSEHPFILGSMLRSVHSHIPGVYAGRRLYWGNGERECAPGHRRRG